MIKDPKNKKKFPYSVNRGGDLSTSFVYCHSSTRIKSIVIDKNSDFPTFIAIHLLHGFRICLET